MKLSNPEEITLDEAIDLLASADNNRDLVGRMIDAAKRQREQYGAKILARDGYPQYVNPVMFAHWAAGKELRLPPALSELLPGYEPPDPDLAGYIKSDKIDRLIITLRKLDNGDGTGEEGTKGQMIIKDSYPEMSPSMAEEALRVFRHVLELKQKHTKK